MRVRHAGWLLSIPLALGAGLVVNRCAQRPAAGAVAVARDPLAPDPAVVRYRHAIAPQVASETAAAIARLEAAPESPQDLSELADLYVTRAQLAGNPADYAAAEVAAKRSLALLPSPSSAPLTLAKIANAHHDFRGAIAHVKAYLAHGSSAGAYILLATAHLALGELPAASDAAETAVDARPSTGSYLMRALVMQAQGRDAEAAYDFARAAQLEEHGAVEESARLRALWGRFLVRRGAYAGAEAVLAEAVRISPDLPLAVAQQGELALRRGEPKRAKQLFDRAFSASREVRYLMDEARAQDAEGDLAGATSTRALVEKLIRAELAETGLGHRLDLVEILVDRGRPKDLREAIALAKEEVARRPSADTRFQLARAFERSGLLSAAAVEIHAALGTGARDGRLYELAARIERGLGNAGRAELYVREARVHGN